jgi:hypothetical protein
MNIYAPSTVGISLRTNGIIAGANYLPTSPVNIASGNPIFVSLLYTANVLRATFVESNTPNTFTTNFALNLPSIVGAQTAYVGFTGADGGVASTQVVSNFIFVPITGISSELTNPILLTLSWPASIGGYTMQTRSNLAPGEDIWQSVTNVTTQTGGQNRVTISPLIENRFFRLSINLTE